MNLRSTAAPQENGAFAALQLGIVQEMGGIHPFQWFTGSGRFDAGPAFAALLGLEGAPLRVVDLLRRIAPEDRQALDALRRRVLAGQAGFEAEFRILSQAGPRWILARGRRIADAAGRAVAIAGVLVDIDARKRLEPDAARRDSGYRAVQEGSLDGFMVFEAVRDAAGGVEDFRWLHVNAAACRIVGRAAGDLLGRRLLEVMPGNRDEGLFEAYRQVVETGRPLTREVTYRHEGLDTHFRISAARAGDGFAVTFADLTQRFRAEQALRAAERQWRAVLDSIPQKVWTALPGGLCDFFNARWYAYTGASLGQTDGFGWTALIHPEDLDRALTAWRRAEAAGKGYEVEYRLRTADAGYRWVLARALPFRDPRGRVLRWFGTCTDIHDYKTTEKQKRAIEERLALALDAARGIAVWDYDVANDRVTAHGCFAGIFGLDPEGAAEGRPLAAFLSGVHPRDRPRVEAAMREAMRLGGAFDAECRLPQPDGSTRWVMARGHCELDAGGRPLRLPGALVDITDLKLAEEARELLAKELSHRIKNIFALVSSLVTVTARDAPEAADFARALRARIEALGRAHDCVRPGAGSTAPTVHALLATLLAPYVDADRSRIRLGGADAAVGAHCATALALILHEAATNSAKYGALSGAGGAVEVATDLDGGAYRIAWSERGGPDVAPPVQLGFGTLMADRAAQQLGGRIVRSWEAGGLRLELSLPVDLLAR